MSISNAHKKLRIAADELEKTRLIADSFGDREKFRNEFAKAEKNYLDCRLLVIDEDIEGLRIAKIDLVKKFNVKYPHLKIIF